jgi:hypothetical protein
MLLLLPPEEVVVLDARRRRVSGRPARAIEDSELAAIAKFVMRDRQYLGALRVRRLQPAVRSRPPRGADERAARVSLRGDRRWNRSGNRYWRTAANRHPSAERPTGAAVVALQGFATSGDQPRAASAFF